MNFYSIFLFGRSFCSYKLNERNSNVVIVAAVRTPTVNSQEDTSLTGFVIDEVVKRSTVPRNEFKKIILCTSSETVGNATLKEITKNLGLKSCEAKCLQISNKTCSVYGLQMTLNNLQDGNSDCVILGDTRLHTEPKYEEIQPTQSELMDVTIPRQKKQTFDGVERPINNKLYFEAAALMFTTQNLAERYNVEPLAQVREVILDNSIENSLSRLQIRQKVQLSNVHSWVIVTSQKENTPHFQRLTKIPLQNICVHDVNSISVSHLLTHLTHSLPAGSHGCAIIESADQRYIIVMIEKLVPAAAQKPDLPLLTLYSKNPCTLCDELVAKLESNYTGAYKLEKIFIDKKENVRFLRLYRHDIPVLFLNGQFLCMHKLNEPVLRERLAALNKENN